MSISTSDVGGRLLTLCVLSGAACDGRDTTQVVFPNGPLGAATPIDAAGTTSVDGARRSEGADAGATRAVDAGATRAADAGATCASIDAGLTLPVQIHFQELYQTAACTFFSSPTRPGLAFTLGTEGTLANRADLVLELGASSFIWSEGAFRRSLECGAAEQPWRFSESIHGSWSAGDPFGSCADPLTRFTGSYHYEECIALPNGACGMLPGSCSQFAVVEMSIAPQKSEPEGVPLPSAEGSSCRPISPRCGAVKCVPAGSACQTSNDCELGLVCVAESCGGPGACQATFDCPQEGEPVCACNGSDYPSACAAHNSAQGVAHSGPCTSDEVGPPIILDPVLGPLPVEPTSGALPDAGTTPLSP